MAVHPPGPALLFCPGDRPERYERAYDSADSVILDLEDAVAAGGKGGARSAVVRALSDGSADGTRTVVRINPLDGPWGADDVRALQDTPLRFVMLPKASDPEQLERLRGWSVIALCETAAGVAAAGRLAEADNCCALMWGGEDLTADLGGRSSRGRSGAYLPHVVHARSTVLLAAGAHGRDAVDGVYLDIRDETGLSAEAYDAAAMGFAAKAAIHPRQVAVIRSAYAPTADQLAWAAEVVDAVGAGGTTTVRGRMVDEPLVRQARTLLALADEQGGPDV